MSGPIKDKWLQSWRGPVLAALLAILAGLPGLLSIPPLDRDESRFVQATTQMLETGDFININYQDTPRHKKPVGIHWFQAMSVSLFDQAESREIWSYRLPSLLGAALMAFATAWGAKAFFGARLGTLAGAFMAVGMLVSTEAFIAKTDSLLCGLIALALAALARLYYRARKSCADSDDPDALLPGEGRYRDPRPLSALGLKLVFWISFALTVLIKGPIGPMVIFLTLLGLGLWDWRQGLNNSWLARLGWSWGLALIALIVGPWAVAITVTTDGAFWGTAIGGDLAPKLQGGHEGHSAPPGTHLLLLSLLFFPGSLLIGLALWKAIQVIKSRPQIVAESTVDPGLWAGRFALCAFALPFLMFELSPTKLVHYPLPTYPGLIWLAMGGLAAFRPASGTGVGTPVGTPLWRASLPMWVRLSGAGSMAFGALCLVVLIGLGYQEHGLETGPLTLSLAGITVMATVAGAGLAILALMRKALPLAFTAALITGFLAHSGLVLFAAQLSPLWVSNRLEQTLIRTGLEPRLGRIPGPVAILGYAEPSFVFQSGTRTALLGDAVSAVEALDEGRPVYVESRFDADFAKALAEAKLTAQPVTLVEGYNYSNGDPVRFTLYHLRDRVPVDGAAKTEGESLETGMTAR